MRCNFCEQPLTTSGFCGVCEQFGRELAAERDREWWAA